MPYFFILPAFVVYLAALLVAVCITFVYPPIAHLRRVLVSVTAWATIGFIVSTFVYVALLAAVVAGVGQLHGAGAEIVTGFALAFMGFVAPVAAAAIGVIGGSVYGVRRLVRKQ